MDTRREPHGELRHVGISCDLTLKIGRPVPGNDGAAIPTRALASEEIARDQVAVALDQHRMAAGTIGVLQITDLSWQIARVDIPQACLRADLGCMDKVLRTSILWISREFGPGEDGTVCSSAPTVTAGPERELHQKGLA